MEYISVFNNHGKIKILVLVNLMFFIIGMVLPDISFGNEMNYMDGVKLAAGHEQGPVPFIVDEPERKDPFVAGILSWAWPGLGQFYTQEYAKGSFFLLADLAQKGLLFYMLYYYSDKYSSKSESLVKWQKMDQGDKTIIILYVFSVLFLRVACVVSAVNCAEDYNRDIYFPYWKSQHAVSLSFDVQPKSINIGVTSSF